ncbi:thioredoxin family protein [Pontiella sulfatireligans]|uniref:Disulfide bond reductase DsbH n=1 Tax=Pontiella sulfatireligans TaxID=2750658 RepID=A0A6C2UMI2_9BACT|nr:thioredoxin family protein [Pontiella sulfatireligans]VGO21480.1 Disulfide bond reductase DsbH [Pontiella sulfatireligans]
MKKWLWLAGAALLMSGCQEEAGKQATASVGKESEATAVEHVGWNTNFDQAVAQAKAEGKHILIDFSGSDWCGWCIKLDKEVFSKAAFQNYADGNLVLVLADFPSDKSGQSAELIKQNEALASQFGVQGFPTVFVLSPEGKAVAKTGYQAGGPEAYVEHIQKLIADAK